MHYNLFEGYLQDSWKVKPRLTLDLGLRLSYMGPWTDNNGLGMAAWNRHPATSAMAPAPTRASPTRRRTRARRFPASTAAGSSRPRASASPTTSRAPVRPWSAAASACTATMSRSRSTLPCSVSARASARTAPTTSRSGASRASAAPRCRVPAAPSSSTTTGSRLGYTWSLNLNQKLPWAMNVELGYVGSRNENLLNEGIANVNAIPLGAMINDPGGNEQLYRPYQAYGDLNVYRHDAYTNYHALQALLSRQRGNFNFTASYTFSKVLGIRTNQNGNAFGSEYIVDPDDFYYGDPGVRPHPRRKRRVLLAARRVQGQQGPRPRSGRLAGRGCGELRERPAAAGLVQRQPQHGRDECRGCADRRSPHRRARPT